MRIVVDGNDGTGKTTLVAWLQKEGFDVSDRGIPTKMTDDHSVQPSDEEIYLILDAAVEISRRRLLDAGKDLSERYHTVPDLTFYRKQFLEVAQLLSHCEIIDATGTPHQTYALAKAAIDKLSRSV